MAKYEITIKCEQWTDKAKQPDLDAIEALLAGVLVDVSSDCDDFDWTDLYANWEIDVYGWFECADDDEADEVGKKVESILAGAGFRQVTWTYDDEDYPMPEHEIIETFRDTILPGVPKGDRIAKWEAFNDYTDSLCKRGLITQWQAENINNPWAKE